MIQEMYIAVNKNNSNEYHSFTWTQDDKLTINGQEVNPQDWDIIAVGSPTTQDPTYIQPRTKNDGKHSLAVDWLVEQLNTNGILISDGIIKMSMKINVPAEMLEKARDMEIDGQYSSYSEGYNEGLYDGMYK